jgi:hypothetical protein
LINKTLIMKWFAKWLDTKPWSRDMADDDVWRRVQATVYGQDEAVSGRDLYTSDVSAPSNDPQSVENMDGGWKGRFAALGLQIPASLRTATTPSAILFRAWQDGAQAATGTTAKAKDTAAVLVAKPKMSFKELRELTHGMLQGKVLQDAVQALVKDGVVFRASKHRDWLPDKGLSGDMSQIGAAHAAPEAFHDEDTFTMRDEYVPKKEVPGARGDYEDKLSGVAHDDYYAFLNRSYLQLGTNALHDEFCKKGLKVANDDKGALMTVYGDNSMLEKGAAEGVEYSAQTARLSIAAIKQWATNGKVDADKTVQAIAKRFPHYVEADGKRMSIEGWHDENGVLHKHCVDDVFPALASRWNMKTTAAGVGELAKKVTKDADVHQGDSF